MKLSTITRDPFARSETVRATVPKCERKECAWCGQSAKYQYGTASDGGSISMGPRLFCSVGCFRDYHA